MPASIGLGDKTHPTKDRSPLAGNKRDMREFPAFATLNPRYNALGPQCPTRLGGRLTKALPFLGLTGTATLGDVFQPLVGKEILFTGGEKKFDMTIGAN